MLDRQYHFYAVDTGHFYSHREARLHHRLNQYRTERSHIREKLQELECTLKKSGYSDKDLKAFRNGKTHETAKISGCTVSQYIQCIMIDQHKKEKEKRQRNGCNLFFPIKCYKMNARTEKIISEF